MKYTSHVYHRDPHVWCYRRMMSSYVQLQFVIKFPIAPDDHPEPKPRIDPPSLAFQCERRTRSHEQQPQQERGVPRRLQRRRVHRCWHKGARSVRARSHPRSPHKPPENPFQAPRQANLTDPAFPVHDQQEKPLPYPVKETLHPRFHGRQFVANPQKTGSYGAKVRRPAPARQQNSPI